jgi:hypothetical protein
MSWWESLLASRPLAEKKLNAEDAENGRRGRGEKFLSAKFTKRICKGRKVTFGEAFFAFLAACLLRATEVKRLSRKVGKHTKNEPTFAGLYLVRYSLNGYVQRFPND